MESVIVDKGCGCDGMMEEEGGYNGGRRTRSEKRERRMRKENGERERRKENERKEKGKDVNEKE
jgi:hypothetical protein